jgi:excisionase family DNA binding protein
MYSLAVRKDQDTPPVAGSRDPIVAPERERRALERIGEALAPKRSSAARLRGPRGEEMIIPQSLYAVLVQAIRQLMSGRAISIVPVMGALTTQQAADMLNVSRPFLVKLLEQGTMPFHRAGTHRRVYLKDLLAYKRKRDLEATTSWLKVKNPAYSQAVGRHDFFESRSTSRQALPTRRLDPRALAAARYASGCARPTSHDSGAIVDTRRQHLARKRV